MGERCAGCLIGRECLRPESCGSARPSLRPERPLSEPRPPSSTFDEAAYVIEHLPKLLAAVLARSNRTVESTRYGRRQT